MFKDTHIVSVTRIEHAIFTGGENENWDRKEKALENRTEMEKETILKIKKQNKKELGLNSNVLQINPST